MWTMGRSLDIGFVFHDTFWYTSGNSWCLRYDRKSEQGSDIFVTNWTIRVLSQAFKMPVNI